MAWPTSPRLLALLAASALLTTVLVAAPGLAAEGQVPQPAPTVSANSAGVDSASVAEDLPDPDIIGGEDAAPGSWPFMAALVDAGWVNEFQGQFCGGTVVDPEWVLTAAHCVDDKTPPEVDVLTGEHELATGGERTRVTAIYLHPGWSEGDASNDMALLHLDRPVAATPVKLARPDQSSQYSPGTNATAVGWGIIGFDSDGNPVYTPHLQEVEVPIYSDAECAADWSIYDGATHICARGQTPSGPTGICQGDSGGPLLVPDPVDGWLQIGISSFVSAGCLSHFADVYTRVPVYEASIHSIIDANAAVAPVSTLVIDEYVPDPPRYAEFGSALDVADGRLVVGAPGHEDLAGGYQGALWIYDWDGSTWPLTTGLLSPDSDAGDQYATSVEIAGGVIAAGAPGDDETGTDTGAAYLTWYDDGWWSSKFMAGDTTFEDGLGTAVAWNGEVLAAGAPWYDGAVNDDTGAVVIWRWNGASWDEYRLEPSDHPQDGRFGAALAIDPAGEWLAVGAPLDEAETGAIYMFHWTGAGWSEEAKLVPSDDYQLHRVGLDLDIDGDRLVAGGPSSAGERGVALIYRRDGTNWTLEQALAPEWGDVGHSDRFGAGVAIDGDTLVVGAPQEPDDRVTGPENVGAIYVYRWNGTAWAEHGRSSMPAETEGDRLGAEVAIDGGVIAAGASQSYVDIWDPNFSDHSGDGWVAMFEMPPGVLDAWGPQATGLAVSPVPRDSSETVVVSAVVDDTATGASPVIAAALSLDGAGVTWMLASDGRFDGVVESSYQSFAPLSAGSHEACISGFDVLGNQGPESCITFDVLEAPPGTGDTEDPFVWNVVVSPDPAPIGVDLVVTADAHDVLSGDSDIVSASWSTAAATGPMAAVDGAFDEVMEALIGTVPGFTAAGLHELCVTAFDAAGNHDDYCILVDVDEDAVPLEGVIRLAGSDRYTTAAAISSASFEWGVPVVYIAVGDNFPDALAAGPAAAMQGGPILLTRTDSLPFATQIELILLGPQSIVVVGGPGVITDRVMTELGDYTDGPVTRLAGADRYSTAAAISAAAFPSGATVAYIGVGDNFPDALAAGPLAGSNGGPILLTQTNVLPSATRSELTRLSPDSIVVVGGSGVVSDFVAGELSKYGTVTRLWGADRYSTAAAICQAGYTPQTRVAYVGVGDNFPDALAAGPVAGIQGGPILLTGTNLLPSATIGELNRIRPDAIVIVGGTGVVSSAVEQQLANYLAP